MKLGLQLGYWGARPPTGPAELVAAAEESGFDAIFTAEAWGSDAFTPLAWWGKETSRVRLGTSIGQMSRRGPTSHGMHALPPHTPCPPPPPPPPRTAGSYSAWASAARRSSKAGTANRSPSLSRGPARSS